MRKQTFRKTAVATLAAAITLGMAATAFAAPDRHDDRRDDRRGDDRHASDHDRWGHQVDMHRGYGPDRRYYIGHTMPREYRQNTYVVDDWRGHHLRQPPRGYHWVQSGGDYLLVAVATGLIASAIINGN